MVFVWGCVALSYPQLGNAQTMDRAAMLQKIDELYEQIITLQRQLTMVKGQIDTNYINQSSLVSANGDIKLRQNPGYSAAVIGMKKSFAQGEVAGNPRYVDKAIWWPVEFSEDEQGWVAESQLTRIPSLVIGIDEDGDGIEEGHMRFVGEYTNTIPAFKHVDGNTVMKIFDSREAAEAEGYSPLR